MQLSVLICTYNYAHFLKDALRTVAAQRFSEFELVIVDDGSTDKTEDLVKQFAPQFHKCTYVKKPHSGLADSRNVGIRTASGSHIAFLDADDLWSPEYLNIVRAAFLTEPRAEIIVTDGFRVQESGDITDTLFPAGLPRVQGQIRTARELFSWFRFAAPSATTLTKSLYERVGLFNSILPNGAEDWHWFIRATQAGAFCVRLNEKLVLYRQHGENLTATMPSQMFEGWLQIYSELLKNAAVRDPELGSYARKITYSRVIRLLSHSGAPNGRYLLDKTMETFGTNMFLRTTRGLTHFGLCAVASLGWHLKRRLKSLSSKKTFDLAAFPERIFEGIFPNLHKRSNVSMLKQKVGQ